MVFMSIASEGNLKCGVQYCEVFQLWRSALMFPQQCL
jgi:hypothetical protein